MKVRTVGVRQDERKFVYGYGYNKDIGGDDRMGGRSNEYAFWWLRCCCERVAAAGLSTLIVDTAQRHEQGDCYCILVKQDADLHRAVTFLLRVYLDGNNAVCLCNLQNKGSFASSWTVVTNAGKYTPVASGVFARGLV